MKYLTPEQREYLVYSIQKGIPYDVCCPAVGITRQTFKNWTNDGENDLENGIDSWNAQLFYDIKKAINERIDKLLTRVEEGKAGWQGSAWILERRWWHYYSPKVAEIEMLERIRKLEDQGKLKGEDNGRETKKVDSSHAHEEGCIA